MASLAPWLQDPTQMDPTTSLGLQLLANSNTPGGFGSIFGRSALAAGQDYQAAQLNQQKIQQGLLNQQLMQQKMQFLGAPGGMGGPQGAQGPQQPPQAAMGGAPAPQGQQGFMPGVSQMPQQGQAFGFTQPPQTQDTSAQGPQQPNPYLSVPSQQDISSIPIGGMSPDWLARYSVAIENKNPLEAYQSVHEQQMKLAQQQLAPKIASLDYLLKSDKPSVYMQADKQLMAAWPQLAQQAGLDPQKDYNDDGVRHALTLARNNFSSAVGLPTVAPTNKLVDDGIQQKDPVTGKVEHEEELEKVIGPNGQPILVPRNKAVGMTPFNQSIFGASSMSDQAIQSAADYARSHGGQMPTGFSRSPAIVAKVWDRIATDNSASGDTMGAITARGQALKANGMALDQITKLETATNQYATTLDKNLDNLVGAYKQAGNAGSPLITKAMRFWQQGVTGDKDTAAMVTWLNAVQGEYAKLKSGSLGNAGATNAAMDDAKEVINKNMNQGGIEAVAAAMRAEKENRVAAIGEEKQRLMGNMSQGAPGASGSTPAAPKAAVTPPPKNAKGWDLHRDAKGNLAYVAPNGKDYEEVK